jgi:hypothetical protein
LVTLQRLHDGYESYNALLNQLLSKEFDLIIIFMDHTYPPSLRTIPQAYAPLEEALEELTPAPLGPNMSLESAPDTFLPQPRRSAAMKAAEKIAQAAEDHSTDDSESLKKKKKTPATFQLSNKVIPSEAGHIKVSSQSRTGP